MPLTAILYSSSVGILPSMADRTTTGVDASNDSPFYDQNLSQLYP